MKIKKSGKCSKQVISIILTICLIITSAICVNAANTHSLNESATDILALEYSSRVTSGITRKTELKVYLNKGEVCCLGSDVYASRVSENDTIDGKSSPNSANEINACLNNLEPSGSDIVVVKPDGTKHSFDVKNEENNKQGFIYSTATMQGPSSYYITDENGNKSTQKLIDGGYDPYCFTADTDGIYTVRFHGTVLYTEYNGDYRKTNTDKNITNIVQRDNRFSTYTYKNSKGVEQNGLHAGNAVGLWDVTVVNPDDNSIKKGRTYANFLALMGSKNDSIDDNNTQNLNVYVLTDDGFIYQVDMYNIDPRGFIFFANNQGLTTNTLIPKSIYHSVYDNNDNMTNLKTKENVTFHSPLAVDTEMNETFKIFFDKPNEDLYGILYNDAVTPSEITDIKFYGYAENEAYYKQGGRFEFTTKNASSTTIKLDFTKYLQNNNWTYNADNSRWELKNDDSIIINTYYGNGIVELNGAVTDGKNTFYWDGADTLGEYIPVGEYTEQGINIIAEPKTGEIHFPMLDVENLLGGVQVKRLNDVVDEEGKIVSNANETVYDIYYNNNPLLYGSITGTSNTAVNGYYQLSDETHSYSYNFDKNHFGSDNAQTGVSTLNSDAVSAYEHTPVNSSIAEKRMTFIGTAGDKSAIDTWTYFKTKASEIKIKTPIKIVEDLSGHGSLQGLIFYDLDTSDKKYNGAYMKTTSDLDYVLPNISVKATLVKDEYGNSVSDGAEYETITDAYGVYHFNSIPTGTYRIDVSLTPYQETIYTCTTEDSGGVSGQSVAVTKDNTSTAAEIGYHANDPTIDLCVKKTWDENATKVDSVTVELWAYDVTQNDNINTGFKATLTNHNSWSHTFTNLPINNNGNNNFKYYVKEYYTNSEGELIHIATSTYNFELNKGEATSVDTTNDEYNVTFHYTETDVYAYQIEIINAEKTKYKVVFHKNFDGNSHETADDIFRVYMVKGNGIDGIYDLTDQCRIEPFYDIPNREDEYIFAGWSYSSSSLIDDEAIRWNTDEYYKTTHIYAHWINVGTIDKDNTDLKITGVNSYRGFGLFGTQIRNADTDPNYPNNNASGEYPSYDYSELGLRFVTTASEKLLKKVNKLFDGKEYTDSQDNNYTDDRIEYGYVVATEANMKKFVNGYTKYDYSSGLKYKGDNVNGEDTSKHYAFVTNMECTSSDYNTNTNISDHRNFNNYRIFSVVVTYKNSSDKVGNNIMARAYLRYVDANGLKRTFYNDYDGNSTYYKSCCTSFTAVNNMINDNLNSIYKPNSTN